MFALKASGWSNDCENCVTTRRNSDVKSSAGIQHKGIDYKWIVLSITTVEMFMVSVNGSIILISLPAIFDGIDYALATAVLHIGAILSIIATVFSAMRGQAYMHESKGKTHEDAKEELNRSYESRF